MTAATGCDTSSAPVAAFAPVGEVRAALGESPVWSDTDRGLWWVDIDGRLLLRTDMAGDTRSWSTGEMPGFVQLSREGSPLVGMETGIFRFDPVSEDFTRFAELPQQGVRCNDACTDSAGRIWFATMDPDNRKPVGTLYRLDPGGSVTFVLDGMLTANGLAWDNARSRLYYSDCHATVQTVWTLPVSDGEPAPDSRAVFHIFDDLPGRPDGAALDEAGGYWIAGVGGAELYRFGPDGTLMERHTVPVPAPTKPAFGGPDGKRIYLTSAFRDGAGGELMAWNGPVRGARVTPFGGERRA